MCAEYLSSKADCLVRTQGSIGPYVQCQFIIIGNLTYTGILHLQVDTLNGSVDRIYSNNADGHIICFAFLSTYIATAFGDSQLHVQLAVSSAIQGSNHLIRIHNLDILISLYVSSGHGTFAVKLDVSNFRLIGLTGIFDCQ